MSILDILKSLLPFLMSAAEKSFKKLPKEKQDQLIKISKLVEVLKQIWKSNKEFPIANVKALILYQTGLDEASAYELLRVFFEQRGIVTRDFEDAVTLFNGEVNMRGESGVKEFFIGIVNILGEVVVGIDWKLLLLGIAQVVFTNKVKGTVKV